MADENGIVVSRFQRKKESEPYTFVSGICVNSLGHIITVDRVRCRIEAVDSLGNLIHSFGSRGSGPCELEMAKGICVDSRDNVFVADWGNCRISVFTPKGIPIRQISVPGKPYAICVSKRRMYVCIQSSVNCVGIFSN